MKKKVLVIGSSVCDINLTVDYLPNVSGDVKVKKQVMQLGGCAFNVASVMRNCGIDFDFLSPVGQGIYGQFVRNQLAFEGINSLVNDVKGDNGCCYCIVDSKGERTFMSYQGVEYLFDSKWLNCLEFNAYSYIYVCGLEMEQVSGDALVNAVIDLNIPIVFAPGPRHNSIDSSLLDLIYQQHPIIHCNKDEIQELTNCNDLHEALVKMYQKTTNVVVVTLGSQGCVYYDNAEHYVDGFNQEVINTIGAGDNHCGAMIAGLMEGYSLDYSLLFANYYSGYVVNTAFSYLSKEQGNSIVNSFKKLMQKKNGS